MENLLIPRVYPKAEMAKRAEIRKKYNCDAMREKWGVDTFGYANVSMDPKVFCDGFKWYDKYRARMPDGWNIKDEWNLDRENWDWFALSPDGCQTYGPFSDVENAIRKAWQIAQFE